MDLAQPLLTLLSVVTQWCIGKADLFGYTEDKLSQLWHLEQLFQGQHIFWQHIFLMTSYGWKSQVSLIVWFPHNFSLKKKIILLLLAVVCYKRIWLKFRWYQDKLQNFREESAQLWNLYFIFHTDSFRGLKRGNVLKRSCGNFHHSLKSYFSLL